MSTTYASPTAIKYLLLAINSIIFTIGMAIATHGVVILIGVQGIPMPYAPDDSESISSSESDSSSSSSGTSSSEEFNQTTIEVYQDRFPSVGSSSVLVIFGFLTMGSSSLGITAIHLDDCAILDTYGYVSFISCFLKFLFFFATIKMHERRYDYNPFTTSAVAALFVATIEIVLGMCACHLAKVIKRGEPDREIPPYPSPPTEEITSDDLIEKI